MIGTLAATIQGYLTGDENLLNEGLNGLSETRETNVNLLVMALSLGRGAKVSPSTTTTVIGGKFTRTIKVIPGRGPGQSRAEINIFKNNQGQTEVYWIKRTVNLSNIIHSLKLFG